jgi:hypothetical protein
MDESTYPTTNEARAAAEAKLTELGWMRRNVAEWEHAPSNRRAVLCFFYVDPITRDRVREVALQFHGSSGTTQLLTFTGGGEA